MDDDDSLIKRKKKHNEPGTLDVSNIFSEFLKKEFHKQRKYQITYENASIDDFLQI